MKFLYLALGGVTGTFLRYLIYAFYTNKQMFTFPWGSLTVNLVGSFLIGLAFAISEKAGISASLRLFLFVGFFGSFTTFSTFSMDTITMLQMGHLKHALTYVISSNLIGFILCYGGILLGQLLVTKF